jgi:hypothetical protein
MQENLLPVSLWEYGCLLHIFKRILKGEIFLKTTNELSDYPYVYQQNNPYPKW